MIKSYKYRLYPTCEQSKTMDEWMDTCRFIYNVALRTKMWAWESAKIELKAFDLNYQLKDLKSIDWIANVDSQALQAEMRKLERAYRRFYDGGGYPKFRSKSEYGSFSCPGNRREINWEKGTLTIPKIHNIPIKLDRKFEGVIKTVTIIRSSTGKYFASIFVDNKKDNPITNEIKEETTVGIDTGISHFLITSRGDYYENIKSYKKNLGRLKVLQRRASKKKKGSNNRRKANKKVAILHEKIKNKRTDYIHKVTHALTHDSQVESIVVEDLNLREMRKNRKLSQALNDVSLGEFYRQLNYKCEWYGINLIKIDRYDPSSKLCSVCETKNDNLQLSDRIWTCSNCATTHDRDFNAAVNIKNFGLKKIQSGSGRSEEPLELPTIVGAVKEEIMNT